MAQKFVCDMCGKKLYHKAALEEHYKIHNPKNTIKHGEGSPEEGYQETAIDQAAKTYTVTSSPF